MSTPAPDLDGLSRATIIGPCSIGAGTIAGANVIIGHPAKASILAVRSFATSRGSSVGRDCILRSGTVIYEDAILGDELQTAHQVVIRERTRIGDHCVLGSGTVVREGAVLGSHVRAMEFVVIAENAQLGDGIFIGPHVTFTAGRHLTAALEATGRMTHQAAADLEAAFWKKPSVVVADGVRIGAHAVLLAGITLGKDCVIAAGAVVSNDVPPGMVAAGNPARVLPPFVK
jgi:acetyltransferase-like isoleucine patch superfamily enzyme